jgi:hypothetical protein
MRSRAIAITRLLVVGSVSLPWAGVADVASSDLEHRFAQNVRPFLTSYCVGCHGGATPAAQFDLYYRDPAYLFTSDLRRSAKQLLQIYFDRWQIEVNHREEKDTLGVGQAQLWNVTSVPKQPVLAEAAYSALLLASLKAFGAERAEAYAELPKWRSNARRPSCLDLITLLRKEIVQQPQQLAPFQLKTTDSAMVQAAAA